MAKKDQDGFYILRRKIKKPIGQYKLRPITKSIGQYVTMDDAMMTRMKTGCGYDITYKSKTWQRKAWDIGANNINWLQGSFLSGITGTKQLQHVKRMIILLKIKAAGAGTGSGAKPVLDTLCGTHSGYAVIDDFDSFQEVMEKWYSMLFDDDKTISYLERAERDGYSKIICTSKIMIIYDDYTYDAWKDYPGKLIKLLGLQFTSKGKVIS